ncbi:MAG: hypothetical protein A3A08_00285 [Candidatus Nealsonbacteria bacterium RIFCSPLOWO2_01_FULL_41_9]|uniref:30S ribosomal protein S21 n=1 Tax=Candidatus Nealsonbacteria bacterium RIFCSPLOWO2_01_FULL_41_9 TaxID=1801671 RepID=A0A1G2EE67_9BACT|nr:MAG: hypothetical protein A3A08_00285 [Candidatus Nealsonbacteria bacterium RIFCSPLOWO2_01_FULL_41_9]
MPLEVKKQNRESNQSLLRRFSKGMQQSGILIRAKKGQFKRRKKSEGTAKKSALRKEGKRIEYEKLKKLGEL